ncbi:MAG: hypothetical protein MUF54_04215, partial [Polyangiaceae bacterium]|nr:hypothetical protein [Polyangiaceae bacterium]
RITLMQSGALRHAELAASRARAPAAQRGPHVPRRARDMPAVRPPRAWLRKDRWASAPGARGLLLREKSRWAAPTPMDETGVAHGYVAGVGRTCARFTLWCAQPVEKGSRGTENIAGMSGD